MAGLLRPAQRTMDLDDLAYLLSEAIRATPTKGRISAYLFGSVVSSIAHADDVDLLVIYSEVDDCTDLREALHQVVLPLPVDLVLMTEEEQRHYRFLDGVKGRQIA